MSRTVTDQEVKEAKQLADDNYSAWGQWVTECMSDDEIREDLASMKSLKAWVAIRKRIASAYSEIENTAF